MNVRPPTPQITAHAPGSSPRANRTKTMVSARTTSTYRVVAAAFVVIIVRRSSGASSRSSATASLRREKPTSTIPYASITPAPTAARSGRSWARKTAAYAAAKTTHSPGTSQRRALLISPILIVDMEDLLHRAAEEAGHPDRERERRVVPALLDRVDRLAGHSEGLAERLLREALGRPQLPYVIPHGCKAPFTVLLESTLYITVMSRTLSHGPSRTLPSRCGTRRPRSR